MALFALLQSQNVYGLKLAHPHCPKFCYAQMLSKLHTSICGNIISWKKV